MKILVDRLGDAPEAFHFEAEPSLWISATAGTQDGAAGEPVGPFTFDVQAQRMAEDVFLQGQVSGTFEFECSRCLARYRHALSESFQLLLEPAGGRTPADPEAAEALASNGLCLGDELGSGWYRGSELVLGPFFLEVIALALPVKPLCNEDCQGLCPSCGTDRNQGRCDGAPSSSDSPFAVLAGLRQGAPRSESESKSRPNGSGKNDSEKR